MTGRSCGFCLDVVDNDDGWKLVERWPGGRWTVVLHDGCFRGLIEGALHDWQRIRTGGAA